MKFLVAISDEDEGRQRVWTVEEWFDCWYPEDEIVCRLDVARTIMQEQREGWEPMARDVLVDLRPTKCGIQAWLTWLLKSNVPVSVIK